VSALIDSIINAYYIAQKCGTDLEHLDQHVNNKKMVLEAIEMNIGKLNNDIEFLPYKLNIDIAEFQEYKKNQPIFQKYINLVNESDIQARRMKLLENDKKDLEIQVLKRDREIERLKRLLSQQREKEGENYIDYQQDIVNFNSINLPLADDNDVEDIIDSS